MSARRVVLAAAAATASLAALPAGVAGSAAPAARCADVSFIGVRASGERWTGHAGMGPAVEHLALETRAALEQHGLALAMAAVAYPAEPTKDLYLPWRGHVRTYFRSIAAGVDSAITMVEKVARDCPASAIVLAGYSQGAMVVHQAVRRIVADDPPAVADRIVASILVGDGDRVRRTRARHLGSAPARAVGIRSALLPWSRHDVALPERTLDVCNAGDLICDFSPRRLAGLGALRRAIAAHRAYADPQLGGAFAFSPLLLTAARWAARRVLAARPASVAPRGPTAVVAGVGASFAGWRAATGEHVDVAADVPAHPTRYRCLVLLLPDPFSAADVAAIGRYLDEGGTVIGVGERGDGGRFTAADASLDDLAHGLGASLSLPGDARDPGTTTTTQVGVELRGLGVSSLGYDWASSALPGPQGRVLARTAQGDAPLLVEQRVGHGTLLFAGDSDLVTGGVDDAFGRGDNARLVSGLCP